MVAKAPMKDMVILLPGITGSVLQKDGKDLWAVSGKAIWSVLKETESTISALELINDDPDLDDLGHGIRATRLIEDTHLVPGLVKIDGYTQASRLITDNFDVTIGDIYNDPEDKAANFYHFPYDWRRDNRVNARILKTLINKRLKCWREKSGAPYAKVILIAHSMGGLISRYYLEVLQGWRDARVLFTFGTPYRGSINGLNFVSNGYKQLFLDFTKVIRSFTSAYQLLPIYPVVKIGDKTVRIAETDAIPNVDKARAQDALAFHREIEAAVEKNLQEEDYKNHFTTVPIVGISQPTMQSAELVDGKIVVSEALPKILQSRMDLASGDGTVPQISAIPIELSSSFNNVFIAESHAALQNQAQILQDIKEKLETVQFSSAVDIRSARTNTIGLAVDDLYLPDEPIALRATVNSQAEINSLQAIITSVESKDTALTFPFEQQSLDQWTLAIEALPAGLYRVAVSAESSSSGALTPSPVHNLFEVVSRD
ncbi:MAG: lecithin--cholesterol acyltransferase [Phormidesmis sp.]